MLGCTLFSSITNSNIDLSQNSSSSYYLHSGKNIDMVFVNNHLNDMNYHSWSRRMKCAPVSKNKVKFMNEDITKSARDSLMFDA